MEMERMWAGDASMKYPRQWVVLVNAYWEPECRLIGDIYLVTPDKQEAHAKVRELRVSKEMGKVAVIEGYVDTPCELGGLWSCSQ